MPSLAPYPCLKGAAYSTLSLIDLINLKYFVTHYFVWFEFCNKSNTHHFSLKYLYPWVSDLNVICTVYVCIVNILQQIHTIKQIEGIENADFCHLSVCLPTLKTM